MSRCPSGAMAPYMEGDSQMASPVVHFEIASADRKANSQFYSDLFGWGIQHMDDMGYSTSGPAGGVGIGGGWRDTNEGEGPSITFYVAVGDLEACCARCEELGGRVLHGPIPIPGVGHLAFLGDPHGNRFGIIKTDGAD